MPRSSDPIPVDPQEFSSYVSEGILTFYVFNAGLAWYAYEYLLTFPLEVEFMCKSKPNLTIILFLINRYAFMLTWALGEVFDSIMTDVTTACKITISVRVVANLLNVICVSGIFILRTYAICGRNKWILGPLSLLFLSRLGLAIRFGVDQAGQNGIFSSLLSRVDGIGNCVLSLESVNVVAIEIILTVAFDTMVFILTVTRTWTLSRQAKAAGIEASLSELLLRDGSSYFGLLSAVTILEAITIFDKNLPTFLYVIVQLGFPLEVILANRLVLNLQTQSQSNDSPNPTAKTDIFFRQVYEGSRIDGRFQPTIDSILGNIGAPLKVGDEPEDDGRYNDEKLQIPSGERERGAEGAEDPLSLERTQTQSKREAIDEGRISEIQV